MAMTATTFFAHFKKINAHINQNPEASAELRSTFAAAAAAFRASFTPDEFRQAIARNDTVSSDLEDRITSALMAFNQERATKG